MISSFSFPTSILFGAGAIAELPAKLKQLNIRQPLIVTDPGLTKTPIIDQIVKLIPTAPKVFSDVTPNPTNQNVEDATSAYMESKCDGVIAVGGGSALDVGKAIRLRIRRPEKTLAEFEFENAWKPLVPFVAIPTTAGTGSEVGRSSVIILDGQKKVFFHPSLLADLVILDPQLTIGLPAKLTAATGADALTHCIESFTSPVFHPLCEAIALEGIHITTRALPTAVRNGADIDARGQMQMAAMMGGIAFQKDLGAVHSLAHPLSSICSIHHGTANALVLPVAMDFNAQRKPGLYKRVGEAMGLKDTTDAATIAAVRSLLKDIGLADGLRAHGVKDEQLTPLTEQAFADGCHATNPVPVTKQDLLQLYKKAM